MRFLGASTRDISANDLMWEFFKRHPMKSAGAMKTVPVKTSYLEMHRPPERTVTAPADGVEVVRMRRPTIPFYRFLYDAVGANWNWVDRKRMSDDELSAVIHDERVEFYVLYVAQKPAGFCELDRRVAGEVELAYFGLMPEFIGQGLGKYFLQRMIDHAFSLSPNRFWLHTCTLDHPIALAHYQKAGFTVYKEETAERKV